MAQTTSQSLAAALSGLSFRNNLNTILGALFSASSGATAPSPTVGGQFWLDTGVSPVVLRVRNNANTAWIAVSPETLTANTLRGNPTGSAAAEAEVSMSALKTMLGYAQSLAGGGYQTLPSGLIVQWGVTGLIANGGGNAVTFPLAFPNAIFCGFATPRPTANNSSVFTVGTRGESTTGMVVTNNSGSSGSIAASWLALGN